MKRASSYKLAERYNEEGDGEKDGRKEGEGGEAFLVKRID